MDVRFIFNDQAVEEETQRDTFVQIKLLKGERGTDGTDGKDGKDGINGRDGIDGQDGKDGKDGTNGIDGQDGQDGYTPIRGTDYWTANDISVIEQYCANYIDENITQAIGGEY